jgi:Na+-transporting methylmalonyl-CoA/oxaloacetate decarboxylase gamma subunit
MRRRTDALAFAAVVAALGVAFVAFGLFVLAPVSWALAVFVHYHMNH